MRLRQLALAGAVTLAVAVVAVIILVIGSSSPLAKQGAYLEVATTTFPLYDFSRNVGDERVRVTQLIPAGQEFHDWEPTPRTIAIVSQSRVLVYNGAGLEPWIGRLVDAASNKNLKAVDASAGLTLMKSKVGGTDPHVWLDPLNAKKMVTRIRDAFIQADPGGEKSYVANAEAYLKRLDELHNTISSELSNYRGRSFIAFHEAFSYFAERYEMKQLAVVGANPDSEPTAEDFARLITQAKSLRLKAVYVEPLHESRSAAIVAVEIGGKVLILDPMDGVSEEDFKAGKNYLVGMREVLRSLVEGFKLA